MTKCLFFPGQAPAHAAVHRSLNDNQLTDLPDDLLAPARLALRVVSLSNNLLTRIPFRVADFPGLTSLCVHAPAQARLCRPLLILAAGRCW
jgi:hypothetical protein